jgi:hypothetical protein
MKPARIASWEIDTIKAIAQRAVALAYSVGIEDLEERAVIMDITAAYAGGCKLRLQDLLTADDLDFSHDVFGINKYLDRSTFKLTQCFTPRYAVTQ